MAEVHSDAATILVVDDEPDILQAIQATLNAFRPADTVLTAASGPAALEVLRTQHVDLILTDFRMPEMDGMQFLEAAQDLAPKAPRHLAKAGSSSMYCSTWTTPVRRAVPVGPLPLGPGPQSTRSVFM